MKRFLTFLQSDPKKKFIESFRQYAQEAFINGILKLLYSELLNHKNDINIIKVF